MKARPVDENRSVKWRRANPEAWKRIQKRAYWKRASTDPLFRAMRSAKNKEYYRRAGRMRMIERTYNLSPEAFAALFSYQGGLCGMCQKPLTTTPNWDVQVDHDHSCCPGDKSCGKCIRGLLHRKCNVSLGHFECHYDEAVSYLAAYRQRAAQAKYFVQSEQLPGPV